jgi:hypothetical protein
MLINKLLTCIDSKYLKVAIFGTNELCFYVGEEEIGISVMLWKDSHKVYIDVEGYAWTLDAEQVCELSVVMSILSEEESISEMRGWVEDLE